MSDRRSVEERPAYVAADFGGRCRIFPAPTADGREPVLLGYQSAWVRDSARIRAGEKSRQIGWTWSEAYSIVRDKSQKDARLDHWISSRDEIQARLFLEDCKGFANLLQIAAADLGERVIDPDGNTAYDLEFANKLRAHSMSSNPDAQAGKRGGRTLDEFALHKDPRKLYSIAYPGITWGGSLSLFSTHRGTQNFFNELIVEARHKGNPKKISLHRVTLQDALEDGFLYKLQRKLPLADERQGMDETDYFNFIRSGCADEESFAEEYMCVPSDDASAFLSYELLDGCKWRTPWEYTLAELAACRNPLYLGGDIGRTRDLTVFWVLEAVGDLRLTRKVVAMQNQKFAAQEAALYELLALPQMRRACIDNTGIGRQLVERAQERFGTYKVEAVTFTGAVKEELAYPARAAFEDKTARIPDDQVVISDFRSIRKETTAAGNIRFAGERGANGHADRFWAFALGLHAGKTQVLSTAPIPFHRGGRERLVTS